MEFVLYCKIIKRIAIGCFKTLRVRPTPSRESEREHELVSAGHTKGVKHPLSCELTPKQNVRFEWLGGSGGFI